MCLVFVSGSDICPRIYEKHRVDIGVPGTVMR